MKRSRSLLPRTPGQPFHHPDVDPLDLPALRDLVRFGVMADDQLARRYADPAFASTRLEHLKDAHVIRRWFESLEGARIYSPTRLAALVAGVTGVRPRHPKFAHLSHDVAVVDLADYLIEHERDVGFIAEDEVRDFLQQIGPPPHRFRHDTRHQPDGLLVTNDRQIAIELEHTDKYTARYARISGWFIRDWRVDSVRWYIDNPRILRRLRDVNASHGFDGYMEIALLEFPPGVRLRQRAGPYEP